MTTQAQPIDSGWKTIGNEQYRTANNQTFRISVSVRDNYPNYLYVHLCVLLQSGWHELAVRTAKFYYAGRDSYDATLWALWSHGAPPRDKVHQELVSEVKAYAESLISLPLLVSATTGTKAD